MNTFLHSMVKLWPINKPLVYMKNRMSFNLYSNTKMYIFTHIHEVFHTTNWVLFLSSTFRIYGSILFFRETLFIIKTIYNTIKHLLILQYCKVAGLDLITQSAIVISKDIFFVIYERYQTPH